MTADGPIPRRVIVTGALGGIGGAVAEAFADAGADVRGIDVRVAARRDPSPASPRPTSPTPPRPQRPSRKPPTSSGESTSW